MLKLFALVLAAFSLALVASTELQAGSTPDTKGVVTAVSAGSLSIRTEKGKTHTFRLTDATNVKKLNGQATRADVKPGASVKVEYSTGTDGAQTATEIKIGIATPNGTYFSDKETGPVVMIRQDTLVINVGNSKPYGFQVIPTTSFQRLGKKIAPQRIKVGDPVKVKFDIAPTGKLTATSVDLGVKATDGLVYSGKEQGTIAALAPGSLTLQPDKGQTISFRIGPQTKFQRNGQKATRAVLTTRAAAKVKFDVAPDGVRIALSITIGTASGGKLTFPKKEKGKVRTISATRLTVRTSKGKSVMFRVTTRTVFERNGRPVRRRFVKVGATVKIKYVKTSQGAKQALVVRLVPGR
jgi:hypothetical protein